MTDVKWLDETESRAWRGYLRMHDLLTAEMARQLDRDAGMSLADYEVLVALSEAPDHRVRNNELAAQLLWEKSRVSHHITRMERRGLVTRESCPSDARGSFVVATADGMAAIRGAAPCHVAAVRALLFDHLSKEQLAALVGITETVVDRLAGAPAV